MLKIDSIKNNKVNSKILTVLRSKELMTAVTEQLVGRPRELSGKEKDYKATLDTKTLIDNMIILVLSGKLNKEGLIARFLREVLKVIEDPEIFSIFFRIIMLSIVRDYKKTSDVGVKISLSYLFKTFDLDCRKQGLEVVDIEKVLTALHLVVFKTWNDMYLDMPPEDRKILELVELEKSKKYFNQKFKKTDLIVKSFDEFGLNQYAK